MKFLKKKNFKKNFKKYFLLKKKKKKKKKQSAGTYIGEIKEGMMGTRSNGLLNVSHLGEEHLLKSAFYSDQESPMDQSFASNN